MRKNGFKKWVGREEKFKYLLVTLLKEFFQQEAHPSLLCRDVDSFVLAGKEHT